MWSFFLINRTPRLICPTYKLKWSRKYRGSCARALYKISHNIYLSRTQKDNNRRRTLLPLLLLLLLCNFHESHTIHLIRILGACAQIQNYSMNAHTHQTHRMCVYCTGCETFILLSNIICGYSTDIDSNFFFFVIFSFSQREQHMKWVCVYRTYSINCTCIKRKASRTMCAIESTELCNLKAVENPIRTKIRPKT